MARLAVHLDPSIPLTVPPATLARLRKNGRAHMSRARRLNKALAKLNESIADSAYHHMMIEIEDFDPIEVYVEQNWICPHCFKRVDITKSGRHPDSCVLGHNKNFANRGGHTRRNCSPWHYGCNAAVAAAIEIPREAKVKRLRAKNISGGLGHKKSKPSRMGGFGRIKGSKWPSRKLQSRNTFKDRKLNDS